MHTKDQNSGKQRWNSDLMSREENTADKLIKTTDYRTLVTINFLLILNIRSFRTKLLLSVSLHRQRDQVLQSLSKIKSYRIDFTMANTNDTIATDSARLRSTPTSQPNNNNNVCSDSMEDVDENDVMMQGEDDNDNDNNSIPTTMGVRAACMELTKRNRSACHPRDRIDNYASNDNISVAENVSSFFIPLPIPVAPGQVASTSYQQQQQQQQQMSMDDNDCPDDISTLTEYSMEENDEDNLSQTTANTAWTCVTEVTGSTIAAEPRQHNFGAMDPRNLSRRRILANKRTRVKQSQETGNSGLFRDNRINRGSDKQKRRRKA